MSGQRRCAQCRLLGTNPWQRRAETRILKYLQDSEHLIADIVIRYVERVFECHASVSWPHIPQISYSLTHSLFLILLGWSGELKGCYVVTSAGDWGRAHARARALSLSVRVFVNVCVLCVCARVCEHIILQVEHILQRNELYYCSGSIKIQSIERNVLPPDVNVWIYNFRLHTQDTVRVRSGAGPNWAAGRRRGGCRGGAGTNAHSYASACTPHRQDDPS